jgi:hypothetical protein
MMGTKSTWVTLLKIVAGMLMLGGMMMRGMRRDRRRRMVMVKMTGMMMASIRADRLVVM